MNGDSYSQSAKDALVFAYSSAKSLAHSCIGSEHILLGLCCGSGGQARQVLFECGVGRQQVLSYIESSVGKGSPSPDPPVYLGRDARQVLEDAAVCACSKQVSDTHLLWGILHTPGCTASRVLKSYGVSAEKIYCRLGETARKEENEKLRLISEFGIDMTKKAARGDYDPLVGREEETDRVLRVLSRRQKSNPVLLGEPGVGKTAIAEEVARRLLRSEVPASLRGKRLFSLDMASVVSGTKYRGEFEDRLRKIIKEVCAAGNVILFIDELHTLAGAGGAEGAIDGANILKPDLARGSFQIMGATTEAEYKKYICRDGALERRFQPVVIREPSVQAAERILFALRGRYEDHHRVRASDDILKSTVSLSVRFMPSKRLPDKAIDLLDEALAAASSAGKTRLNEEILEQTVACMSGCEKSGISRNEKDMLRALPRLLRQEICGQDKAIDKLCSRIAVSRLCGERGRPRGAFLFCGPSGVGKTGLAKALAKHLCPASGILRFDMSEYMEKHSVSRLIGAPPGYAGYGDGGLLTDAIRKCGDRVVLFDEIEKAHPRVLDLLLQILDEGVLTDSEGKSASFALSTVILTSNIGSEHFEKSGIGFGGAGNCGAENEVIKSVKKTLRPELLGRLDEIIVFSPLSPLHLETIAEKELRAAAERLKDADVSFTWDKKIPALIAGKCRSTDGARRLRHSVEMAADTAAAEKWLSGQLTQALHLSCDERENMIYTSY